MSPTDLPRASEVPPPAPTAGGNMPITAKPVLSGEPSGPTVLVAVEDTEGSVHAVRTAHRLFGDTAQYFVINVGTGRYTTWAWGSAYPLASPMLWFPPTSFDDPGVNKTSREVAEETADAVATRAGLDDVVVESVAMGQVEA